MTFQRNSATASNVSLSNLQVGPDGDISSVPLMSHVRHTGTSTRDDFFVSWPLDELNDSKVLCFHSHEAEESLFLSVKTCPWRMTFSDVRSDMKILDTERFTSLSMAVTQMIASAV
jgi:hypothetical protein